MAGTFAIPVQPFALNGSPQAQLAQLNDYMYQLVEKLNVEFDAVQTKVDTVASAAGIAGTAADSQAARTQDAVQRFNEIKSLIIKSADIVNAYYEYAKQTFVSNYTAESDFGKYIENITNTIKATAEGLEQNISAVKQIQSDTDMLMDITGYIRVGLIDDDEVGIELYREMEEQVEGETVIDSRRFATFTTSGIKFYDQDKNEVSYISDGVLHIYRAEILTSIGLGNMYEVDVSDGIAFMWRGNQ